MSVPSTFTVKAQAFEGPLELLLSLIEKRKLHISDIALADIVDDYISHIDEHTQDEKKLLEFLAILGTLLLIKSRALLPGVVLSKEDKGEIDTLKKNLEKYESLKKAQKTLFGSLKNPPLFRVGNLKKRITDQDQTFKPFHNLGIDTLRDSALAVAIRMPKLDEKYTNVGMKKKIGLEQVMSSLLTRIKSSFKSSFSSLLEKDDDSYMKVLRFLAILELVRTGKISAEQQNFQDEIIIETQEVGLPRYGA